jgi:hypothetical protein
METNKVVLTVKVVLLDARTTCSALRLCGSGPSLLRTKRRLHSQRMNNKINRAKRNLTSTGEKRIDIENSRSIFAGPIPKTPYAIHHSHATPGP